MSCDLFDLKLNALIQVIINSTLFSLFFFLKKKNNLFTNSLMECKRSMVQLLWSLGWEWIMIELDFFCFLQW